MQRRYVAELAKVVRTGGRLYVGCCSGANPDPWSNPRRLSEDHLRALFAGPAWRVESVEPAWYAPVLPLVLVNGADGIGTGWSTSVPNYNPAEVIANCVSVSHPPEPVDDAKRDGSDAAWTTSDPGRRDQRAPGEESVQDDQALSRFLLHCGDDWFAVCAPA